jgi:hypothetical protein
VTNTAVSLSPLVDVDYLKTEIEYDLEEEFKKVMSGSTEYEPDAGVNRVIVPSVDYGMPLFVHLPTNGMSRPGAVGQTIKVQHPYNRMGHDEEDYDSSYSYEYVYQNCDILCKSGAASGGHYIAYGLRTARVGTEKEEKWYRFDDSIVTGPFTPEEVRKDMGTTWVPRAFMFKLVQIMKPPSDELSAGGPYAFTFDDISKVIATPDVLFEYPGGTSAFGRRRARARLCRADFIRAYCEQKQCSKEYALKKYKRALSALQ